ncbi:anti-sigma factor antagonist [Leptospira interrogans]|uniref:Anti-sigma factor antagonist n=18 Tax=Leptospira interrogans TaxID=173 RepID=Q8EZH0_LEPIN|nr:anti-sigma factor antagonist [Leptospira interrogans serovar Lai str. 56601]AAS71649.1 anti-sigma factor antagonist [Leptospira interrogans serovar Copenhageni str. Fiocruz L1-130]AER03872.1 anti-sigma factor antagonist [Leptospira interrogans serovar Lai str. IPAV]AJR15808.1 anti-sigma factor antagonist [Leptospira interrogans serovar Linhai str. 56609]ALE41133.1 anti-sigma factor antagonist [Leptospira interrogans serovar Hardjo str. Norma]ARB95753.1 anti-sigma factor antagonist [Leptospi
MKTGGNGMGSEDSLNLDAKEVDFSINELDVALQKEDLPENFPENAVILKISGEINLYSAYALKEKFFDLIDRGFIFIFVNMEKTRYIDSSGLAVFVNTHTKFVEKGKGGMAIFSPSSHVKKILELTKLKSTIRVVDSLAESIKILLN